MDSGKKGLRPWWMINGAREPMGDIHHDRLWPEWKRDLGDETENKEE